MHSFHLALTLATYWCSSWLSMTTVETLNRISDRLNIYWGLLILLFGLWGTLWNLLVLRHLSFRSNSCCTYLLVGSIASLIELVFGLSDRIINQGFHVDWTSSNIAWCKIRYFLSSCASLIALSCLVMSLLDRFFSTCSQIKWRRLTSVYTARQICVHLITLWMLSAIPVLFDIRPIRITSNHQVCRSSLLIESPVVTNILSLCFYGLIPWCLMVLFVGLTLKNIRHRYQSRTGTSPFVRILRIDQQLISILFVQTVIFTAASFPYCVQRVYDMITILSTRKKDEDRLAQEYLLSQIVELMFYFNYTSMFYGNYLASRLFRQSAKEVWMNLCKSRNKVSQDTIIVHHQRNGYASRHRRPKIFTCLVPFATARMWGYLYFRDGVFLFE